MTMLSAQPVTLTGEQHDRMWGVARRLREVGFKGLADEIETILIAAQNAAPDNQSASEEVA